MYGMTGLHAGAVLEIDGAGISTNLSLSPFGGSCGALAAVDVFGGMMLG